MRRSRALTPADRRFNLRDGLDPRWLQLCFAVCFAFAMALLALGGSSFHVASLLGIASLLCLAVTGLVLVTPWQRVPRPVAAIVPVLDIGAIGISALDPAGWAVAPLLVLPVLWMAGTFHRIGAFGAGLSALFLFGVPSAAYLGPANGTLAWSILVPLAVTTLGLAFVEGIDRFNADRDQLSRQDDALELAATTIAEQRVFAAAILATVDVGLVLLDHGGAVRTSNEQHRAFMKLVFPDGDDGDGFFAYDVDGTTLLSREQLPETRAIRREEFDDCLIWAGEDPKVRRALSVSARTVRDDEGGVVGATLAYKDVTEFVRALHVKDEFIASVSHELRTPLTSIQGYVDLVLDQDDVGEDTRSFLRVASRNGERLQRLVSDLLHTVQVDAGTVHIVRAPSDLAAVVRESVETARPLAEAAGLQLTWEVPDELWAVLDGQRMAQVVDNLLSNAIKYTTAGSVHVSLTVGDRVQIEVRDTGIGIDAMDREHLFTRFYRARHAQDHSIEGVGLGLSIIKSIVESHGGRVEVDSRVGRGSTFQVRLPLDLLRPDVPAQPAATDVRAIT
jgi:two-component system, OmpR family, phosphate regulon sensor histidine kinase PhoR